MKMSQLIHFEIKELPTVHLVGKEIRYSEEAHMKGDNRIPGLWDQCFSEGIFAQLESQADYLYDDSYVGVMLDWDKGDGNFSYVCGMLMKPGVSVPEGFICHTLEAAKAAVGWIRGKDTADVCSTAHAMTEERLKAEGHNCQQMRWCMELYNCPRFTTPDENGDIILDYYIPLD